MTIHKSGNYSFREPPFEDGDVIEGGNYAQIAPGTEICSDVTDLTIHGGNFMNCTPQPTWDVTGGNWSQKEFCANLHPELIEKGLPAEPEDCPHRSAQKEEVELSEDEVRDHKKNGKPLPEYKAEKVKDKDDVDIVKHTVKKYVYKDVTR